MNRLERNLAAQLGVEYDEDFRAWADEDRVISNWIRAAGNRVGNGQGYPKVAKVTRNYYLLRFGEFLES